MDVSTKLSRAMYKQIKPRFKEIGLAKCDVTGGSFAAKQNGNDYYGVSFYHNYERDKVTGEDIALCSDMCFYIHFERADECRIWTFPVIDGPVVKGLSPYDDRWRRPSIWCSWYLLSGHPNGSYDRISSLDEVPALCDRWIERYCQDAKSYFETYSDLTKVADLLLAEDEQISLLLGSYPRKVSDYALATCGAPIVRAAYGHAIAREYIDRRSEHYSPGLRQIMNGFLLRSLEEDAKGIS